MADVVCLRLMQAFRRVSRGMRRWQDGSAPPSTAPLSPRHIAAMQRDWAFHVWDERESVVRWMTAFDTSEADVDTFIAGLHATAAG